MSPILAVGLAFSLGLSIFLLIFGVDTPDSTIIGLTSVIISLLLELMVRITRLGNQLVAASRLSQDLVKDEKLFTLISSIVRDYHAVVTRKNPYAIFSERARDVLSECSDGFHNLVEGYMILPPLSPFSFGLKGLPEVQHSIKSTSYVDAREFWSSVAGEKYLQANAKLVAKGVDITRIFIGDRATVASFKEVMSQHRAAGIRVLVAVVDEIPRELCEDFLVADDTLLVQLQLTRDGLPRAEKMSMDPQEVRHAINGFDRLTAGAY